MISLSVLNRQKRSLEVRTASASPLAATQAYLVAVLGIQALLAHTAAGQEVPDPLTGECRSFQIMDLRFTYPDSWDIDDEEETIGLDDVVAVNEAVDLAYPSALIEYLIEDQLPNHEFHLKQAKLSALNLLQFDGKSHYLWSVTWSLFPKSGGFTGAPWTYRAIVTGNGKPIRPQISLWSTYPVGGDDQVVCSEFKLEDLKPAGESNALFGDRIAAIAKRLFNNCTLSGYAMALGLGDG